MLGSAYGWSKEEILDRTYFDEFYYLSRRITRRRITEWRMQLAITQNPHLKPEDQKNLWENLKYPEDPKLKAPKFDERAFALLKSKLSQGSRFVVK